MLQAIKNTIYGFYWSFQSHDIIQLLLLTAKALNPLSIVNQSDGNHSPSRRQRKTAIEEYHVVLSM